MTTTWVGRLLVRQGAPDPPLRTQTIRRQTQGWRLQPAALPPAGILVVQRLEITLRDRLPPPDAADQSLAEGERTARAKLDDLVESASRPQHGRLPPRAAAVLFHDESELLACWVADILRGTATQHSWWRFMPGQGPRSSVASALTAYVHAVPGAFDLLSSWRLAEAAVAQMPLTEVLRVLDALTSDFDLLPPGSLPEPVEPARSADGGPGEGTAPPATWERWLGPDAVPRRLSPPAALLLGTALLLHRHPGAARSEEYLDALRQPPATWPTRPSRKPSARQHPEHSGTRPNSASEDDPVEPDQGQGVPQHSEGGRRRAQLAGTALHQPRPKDSTNAPGPTAETPPSELREDTNAPNPRATDDPLSPEQGPRAPGPGPPRPAPPATLDSPAPSEMPHTIEPLPSPSPDSSATKPSTAESPTAVPSPLPASSQADDTPTTDAVPGAIATGLAGVFYLVNVMRSLELPQAFRTGWRLPELGGWAVLDGLARALLDTAPSTPADDPVWAVLSALHGRHPELDRTIPQPTPAYRLPESWWAALAPTEPCHWASHHGMLRTWSAAGFVVTEGRRQPGPAASQAADLLSAYSPAPATPTRRGFDAAPLAVPGQLTAVVEPSTRQWLALATPFVQRRIAAALNVSDETVPAELLVRPGLVYTSRTHIDVVMDLADVSLPIRLAGLDQNPGWVPSLGRVVTFTYR